MNWRKSIAAVCMLSLGAGIITMFITLGLVMEPSRWVLVSEVIGTFLLLMTGLFAIFKDC